MAQSRTINRAAALMSRHAASVRAGGAVGTAVLLSTDLKLVFFLLRGGGGVDASRSEKGPLLPASGQFEQNVSPVLTSTPSAVLVHVTSLVFFFYCIIFFVNSLYFSFPCLFPLPLIWVLSEWKPKRWLKKNRGELLSVCGALRRQLHAAAGRRTRTNSAMWRKPRNGCNKSASPQGCLRHRTFQLDTRWCGFSFAITPVCNSDQMSVNSKGKQSRHRFFFLILF